MAQKRVHFIAIGGSIMTGLAVALKKKGYTVSGSDDLLYEPSKSILHAEGLLPATTGWHPDKITSNLDRIIVGMHAKADNPELLKAQSLKIPVYSFPAYILSQSMDKQRIVIAGSHGKTTITTLIIHTLLFYKRKFDYVVGAKVAGVENTVKLSDDPIILIEGDEYPCSPLDSTPKFIKYAHHIGVISGIAWDHANVFPSEKSYNKLFEQFADATPKGGVLVYNDKDATVKKIGKIKRTDVNSIPYPTYKYTLQKGTTHLIVKGFKPVSTQLFGLHNIQNISAAWEVLKRIGITPQQFFEALPHFKGVEGRLERIFKHDSLVVYKDFAHSPSKVRASIQALKELHAKNTLVACLELHTLSSLSTHFLPQYRNSMRLCDIAIIYYNSERVNCEEKNPITTKAIHHAFNDDTIKVFTDKDTLTHYLVSIPWRSNTLLMMSSGNFDKLDLNLVLKKIPIQQPQSTL